MQVRGSQTASGAGDPVRFIGDIHGEVTGPYSRAVRNCEESVQVGDFGRGFLHPGIAETVDTFHTNNPGHKFIRGNHDDPADCARAPGWIKDGTYDADREIMYIGGAWSIDYALRVPGRNWWPDEELSVPELARIHAEYVYHRPRVVVTHDCPHSVAMQLFFRPPFDTSNYFRTRTSEALEAMLREYQPDLWVFGHWHEDHRVKLWGTEFVCIGIGNYVDIDL